MNPYKILGIDELSSNEEVKRAYLAKAAKHHPDAGGDAWAFEQVRAAYEQVMKARTSQAQPAKPSPPNQPAPSSPYNSADRGAAPNPSSRTKEPDTAGHRPEAVSQSPRTARIANYIFSRQLPLQSETSFFILINVLDIVMTNILLRYNAMEANPLAKLVLEQWGFNGMIAFKMFIVAMVCVIAQVVALKNLNRAKQLLYVGCGIVGLVVVYSAALLAYSTR